MKAVNQTKLNFKLYKIPINTRTHTHTHTHTYTYIYTDTIDLYELYLQQFLACLPVANPQQ